MAKIGIICDNYKVNIYKEALNKKGYKYETYPQGKTLTVFKIAGDLKSDQPIIHEMCKELETKFQVRKN